MADWKETLKRFDDARSSAEANQLKELKRLNRGVDALAKMQLATYAQAAWGDLSRKHVLVADLVRASLGFRSAPDAPSLLALIDRLGDRVADVSANLYERLTPEERSDFLKWILIRYGKIDTRSEAELTKYAATLDRAKALPSLGEVTAGGRTHKINDLSSIGYGEMRFATASPWILTNDFFLKQYHHPLVHPRRGDVIIDAGAFHGDSALLFAHDTGYECDIHSFELSERNIDVIRRNIDLNPKCEKLIRINRIALSNQSGKDLSFDETLSDPSMFSLQANPGNRTGLTRVTTISLDDYVRENRLAKVDFVKMDIEGGEGDALLGAQELLSQKKPRLAIALYHNFDDL
ncbi:MAG: FkbM family methyltransferase [Sandaracinus sp.]|nr:FkbM family methyltransferase [Sandaracinus sp.]MCB9636594.1 FkbM family methyltransferase [Sandaracinus sp.]